MFEGILQPTHLIIILIIVLVVFGPGKLPEIGGALGRSMSEFKRSVKGEPEAAPPAETSSAPVQSAQLAAGTKCPSCGHEVPSGSQFCGNCGEKVA